MQPIITVDTDNAIVRLYSERAGQLAEQLRRDAEAIAAALSHATGARFRVEVVR